MPNTPHRLYYGAPGTGVGSVAAYTVPVNARVMLKQVMVCSNHSADTTISIYVVPSGGTTPPSGSTNRAIFATITPGQTETIDMSAVMMPGDTLWISASIGNVLQVWISGVVNS